MAAFKNYYAILELEAFAGPYAVKTAYRRLARQYHPDLNADKPDCEEKFKAINEAYDTLGRAEKRAIYDISLKAIQDSAQKKGAQASKENQTTTKKDAKSTPKPTENKAGEPPQAPPPPPAKKQTGTNSAGFFESFLKIKAPRQEDIRISDIPLANPLGIRGEDITVKTLLTPQEANDGTVKAVNIQHNELCKRCSSTGKVNGSHCSACHGEKILSRAKKLDVRIPPGVSAGSRIRVAREGGRGSQGGDHGDLFLQIEILPAPPASEPDPTLRVDGNDVYYQLAISVTDAALGATIEIPTLHGGMRMTIPPGTQPGKIFRLREQGVQSPQGAGDQLVTIQVQVPEHLSPQEKKLYEELAKLRSKSL